MSNQNPESNDQNELNEAPRPAEETKIFVNEYGATHDQAVVVEEADRTVLLTKDQTIIVPKEPELNIAPKNRPRKIYGGMWGPAEIATVGVSLLAVLTVVLLYLFYVIPAKKELERNRAERDRLETELKTAKSRYGDITSTEQGVARLVSSVSDFETRFLPIASNGRTSLYQRINGLIGAYGLVNTSGPDYSPLEIAGGRTNQAEQENGRSKFQSIFPGVYVSMTVEGSYQNLRRFIREIETSNQFVVITSVQLEPSDTKEKQQNNTTAAAVNNGVNDINEFNRIQAMQGNPIGNGANPIAGGRAIGPTGEVQPQNLNSNPNLKPAVPAGPRGKTHGEIVSLHLEMAAYFRRPNFVPLVPEEAPAP